jgi:excisionase family DNA binding protein
MNEPQPLLISRREAATLLGLSLRTLDYLIARKELCVRKVGRRVLLPRRAVEKFVNASSVVRKSHNKQRTNHS